MTTTATNETATNVAPNEDWLPAKGEYPDDELKNTPIFKRIKHDLGIVSNGKRITLPDESILPLAREAVKEMWETLQVSRFSDSISAVFAALDAAEVDHGNEVLIRRTEEGVCTYKLTKTGGRKRFSHEGYAKLLGYGEDEQSETYKAAIEKLKKAGYNPAKDLHGGFLILKNQMKNPNKNGVFELVIEEGQKGNDLCETFTARLYQFPDIKAKVPVVVFPPKAGRDKSKLVVNDEVIEVASMSQMMKSSIINGAQTPAVMFGLVERLKLAGEDVSDLVEDAPDEESADADADESSDEEAPAASKPAPAAPAKKSAAKSIVSE